MRFLLEVLLVAASSTVLRADEMRGTEMCLRKYNSSEGFRKQMAMPVNKNYCEVYCSAVNKHNQTVESDDFPLATGTDCTNHVCIDQGCPPRLKHICWNKMCVQERVYNACIAANQGKITQVKLIGCSITCEGHGLTAKELTFPDGQVCRTLETFERGRCQNGTCIQKEPLRQTNLTGFTQEAMLNICRQEFPNVTDIQPATSDEGPKCHLVCYSKESTEDLRKGVAYRDGLDSSTKAHQRSCLNGESIFADDLEECRLKLNREPEIIIYDVCTMTCDGLSVTRTTGAICQKNAGTPGNEAKLRCKKGLCG